MRGPVAALLRGGGRLDRQARRGGLPVHGPQTMRAAAAQTRRERPITANEGDGVEGDLADIGAGTGFVMNGRSPAGGHWRVGVAEARSASVWRGERLRQRA